MIRTALTDNLGTNMKNSTCELTVPPSEDRTSEDRRKKQERESAEVLPSLVNLDR